jgi:predicted alpha/beta-fold hydrolase
MDLACCVSALERRSNFVYQWNFVRNLKARMRRKAAAFPADVTLGGLRRIWTVRAFDEAYTAPHHRFRDAADYYHKASAMRVVDRIRVPTLVVTAADDPFVPTDPFRNRSVAGNPNITVVMTAHGGHCAYVEAAAADYDGYWAEREIVRFVEAYRGVPSASARTPAPSPLLRA